MINKVEIANTNTSKLKVLTNKENRELFLRLKDGDLSAREELIKGNLRLVLSIIHLVDEVRMQMICFKLDV